MDYEATNNEQPTTLPDEPPVEKPTEAAPKKRPGPAMLMVRVLGTDIALKAIKYPMPLKAARFHLTINGDQCEAAQTTFGEIRYTYFMYNGASFYIPGHHGAECLYEFQYPEGYKFQPLKLDRRAQSEAAAKAKAAKAAANPAPQEPDAAPASGAAAVIGESEGGSSPEPEKTLQEPEPESAVGKKSKRAQR